MSDFMKDTLGVDETSDVFMVQGQNDLLISGLSSGLVKLQVLFTGETSWLDMPGGSFTEDVYKTIFISEDQTRVRFTGVTNNAGVVVRLGRGLVG